VGQRAQELASKALALDDTNSDAHSVLAYVKTYFDYDWAGAERAYQRALQLNPSSSDACHRYSHYLMIVGKWDEGLGASHRAIELNPFDRTITGHHVWTLYMARRYDEAARYAASVLAADPANAYARGYSALVYEQLRDYQRIIAMKPRRDLLARAFALSGAREDARRLLDEMLRDTTGMNAPFVLALVYLALGDKEKTLDWLEQGYERRVYPLPDIRVDARFDSLRSEKRFQQLLGRMGLDAPATGGGSGA
jgi:tetratricopeptide (TPR) repeat protein